jgi:hypothetical protein
MASWLLPPPARTAAAKSEACSACAMAWLSASPAATSTPQTAQGARASWPEDGASSKCEFTCASPAAPPGSATPHTGHSAIRTEAPRCGRVTWQGATRRGASLPRNAVFAVADARIRYSFQPLTRLPGGYRASRRVVSPWQALLRRCRLRGSLALTRCRLTTLAWRTTCACTPLRRGSAPARLRRRWRRCWRAWRRTSRALASRAEPQTRRTAPPSRTRSSRALTQRRAPDAPAGGV